MVSPIASKPISSAFHRVAKYSSQGIYRLFGAPSSVLKSGQEFRVDFRQLPLALVSAGALVYSQGQEYSKPQPDERRWAKLLAEGGLIYALMATTSGILPLLALGTAAYRSGKEPNILEKLQETTKVLSMVFMGYIGAMTGLNYSMHAVDDGAKELLPHLKDARLWTQFNPETIPALKRLLESGGSEQKAAGEVFSAVRDAQKEAIKAIEKHLTLLERGGSDMDYKLAQEYRKDIEKTLAQLLDDLKHPKVKTRIENQLHRFSKRAAEGTISVGEKAKHELLSQLKNFGMKLGTSHSGYVRMLRMGNPIFGAMIGATLMGIPLSKGINNLLEKSLPFLKKEDLKIPTDTIWLADNNPQSFFQRPSFNDPLPAGNEISKTDFYSNPILNPGDFPIYQSYRDTGGPPL